MTETDYIEKIRSKWGAKCTAPTDELLQLVEQGLQTYPDSTKLHCLRGDLIQLSDGSAYKLEDALVSYERAIEIDPKFAEAHESIGYYCDIISHDLKLAEQAFRRAIELGAGVDSYVGLARVLAELGHSSQDILKLLNECPFHDTAKVHEIRSEIEKGAWKPKTS